MSLDKELNVFFDLAKDKEEDWEKRDLELFYLHSSLSVIMEIKQGEWRNWNMLRIHNI